MNVLIQDLANRLEKNDPTLNRLAINRLPLWTVTWKELKLLLQAVKCNDVVTQLDFWLTREQAEWVQEDSLEESNSSSSSGDYDFSAVQDNELDLQPYKGRTPANTERDPSYLREVFAANTTLKCLQIGFDTTETKDAIIYLIQGLQANKSIESLNLECTGQLNVPTCETLASYLISTNSLKTLVLTKLQSTTPEGLTAIAQSLAANTSIETVEISQMARTADDLRSVTSTAQGDDAGWIMACAAMFHAFGKMRSLHTLRLIDCDLPILNDVGHGVCCHEAIQHLCQSQTLKCLRWIECDLTTQSLAALADGLTKNQTLQILDLRGNGMAAEHCNELVKLLGKIQGPLLKLILEENLIGDDGLKCMADLLLRKSKKVNLRSNLLTSEGCVNLAQAMTASRWRSCIKVLDLSENAIGDDGARAIGKALANNSHPVSELLLDCCLLTDVGIAGLMKGLSSDGSKISCLSLAQNRIGVKGAQHIAEMLVSNKNLKSLELASCHIPDEAVATLALALSRGNNTSLQKLSLGFNAFGDEGVTALGEMLSNDSRLEQLEVQFNEFGDKGLEALIQGLSENYFLWDLFILNGSTYSSGKSKLIELMSHWLYLNRAGRRALLEESVSQALWPVVLERARRMGGSTAVFYMLQARPPLDLLK